MRSSASDLRDSRLGAFETSPTASLHPVQTDRLWTGLSRDLGVLPNSVCYFQLVVAGRAGLSIPGFVGLPGLSFLNLLFYMTLALMLATLFQ